ncbi:MAG: methionine--tRNA ligase [Proteobacteria bacterium]|nr:methionine--tRNA ligase [Pseudomonadota bacterium]
MNRILYFTTPIYYVNAEPHIGHLYTTVLVDTLKRYHLMMGDETYFLTGTDEHGEKIAQVAEKQGIDVQKLTDHVTSIFQETWKKIGISNDDSIHTTEPRHKKYVQDVLQKVYEIGDIYFDEYTGLYCVGCERYMTAVELKDGKCPDHQIEPKEVKEANYFFRMGKYQQELIDHIEKNPGWIRPERFRNEVLSFLKQPLEDLCISRPKTRLTWGIELPFDDKFVTYVWFDALLNYISAIKKTTDGRDIHDNYWPGCNHVIGKDILKTHCIYWPTMLMSAKIYPKKPLFNQIDIHGYWLSGDSKMSKSLGNVVRPLTFDRQFGIENLRYFFFREMKFGQDANFTYELFVERYNADLANGLGNLLSRVASILKKNLGGIIPQKIVETDLEQKLAEYALEVVETYPAEFENRRFHIAIENIRKLLAAADGYINNCEPWRLAKQEGKETELKRVLYNGLEVVRITAILLSPIMPETCRSILNYLGEERPLDGSIPFSELSAWGGLNSGYILGDVPRAFPRIDDKKLKAILEETKQESQAAKQEAGSPEPGGGGNFEPIGQEITIDDFAKVDLRVGIVQEAGLVEGAKKLVRLMVDIGEGRLRQIFAGIRSAYPEPEKLIGTKVIVVANLKPRKMKFGLSEGMVLAGSGPEDNRLCTATFDGELLPGDKVS